mgnify:CR=1 FL=1
MSKIRVRNKKISDNLYTHSLSTRISLPIKEKFAKLSSEEMKSPSSLLREIVFLYLNDESVRETVRNFSYQFEILELKERINFLESNLNNKIKKRKRGRPKKTEI